VDSFSRLVFRVLLRLVVRFLLALACGKPPLAVVLSVLSVVGCSVLRSVWNACVNVRCSGIGLIIRLLDSMVQ
jgi:hypothetical protein